MYIVLVYDISQIENGQKDGAVYLKYVKNICPIYRIRYLKGKFLKFSY